MRKWKMTPTMSLMCLLSVCVGVALAGNDSKTSTFQVINENPPSSVTSTKTDQGDGRNWTITNYPTNNTAGTMTYTWTVGNFKTSNVGGKAIGPGGIHKTVINCIGEPVQRNSQVDVDVIWNQAGWHLSTQAVRFMLVDGLAALYGDVIETGYYPGGGWSALFYASSGTMYNDWGWFASVTLSNGSSDPMDVYIGSNGPYSIDPASDVTIPLFDSASSAVQALTQFRFVINPDTDDEEEYYVDGATFAPGS
jgi:hypothetical protein